MTNPKDSITKAIRFKKALVDQIDQACVAVGDISFSSFIRIAVAEKLSTLERKPQQRRDAA